MSGPNEFVLPRPGKVNLVGMQAVGGRARPPHMITIARKRKRPPRFLSTALINARNDSELFPTLPHPSKRNSPKATPSDSRPQGQAGPDGASRRPSQLAGARAGTTGAGAQDGAQPRPRCGEVALGRSL